jgi:hypothetical protein
MRLRGKEAEDHELEERALKKKKKAKEIKVLEQFKGIEVIDIDKPESDKPAATGGDTSEPCKGKSCKKSDEEKAKRKKAQSGPGPCSCECSVIPCKCECEFPTFPIFAEDGSYEIAQMKGPMKKLQKKLVEEKARMDKRQAKKQARLDKEAKKENGDEDAPDRRLCDGEDCDENGVEAAEPMLMCFCSCVSFPCPCSCGDEGLKSFDAPEPTTAPTTEPTTAPTDVPTTAPTDAPTTEPTDAPTAESSTPAPSLAQTQISSGIDTGAPSVASDEEESPTLQPSTEAPSETTTAAPSLAETQISSDIDTGAPSEASSGEASTTVTSSPTDPIDNSASDLDIENLVFVDVGNSNTDISTVENCRDCLTNETLMSIRAEPFGVVGSVYLEIIGEITETQTENESPYMLFGDTDGVVTGKNLPVGAYLIKAQAFSEADLKGDSGVETTAYFYVV